MALNACPNCSARVSDAATHCFRCGRALVAGAVDLPRGPRVRLPEATEAAPDEAARATLEFRRALGALTPRVYWTSALVAVNVIVFAVMVTVGQLGASRASAASMEAWGAEYGPLTSDGQWWRLLTSNFLHWSIGHLLSNVLALILVGPLVERLIGNAGFLVLYLLTGLAGSLIAFAWNPLATVAGASGAVFGVYGALLGFIALRRRSIPARVFTGRVGIGLLIIACNLQPFIYVDSPPEEDLVYALHCSGFGAGLVLGMALSRPISAERPARGSSRVIVVGSAGGVAVLAAILILRVPSPTCPGSYGASTTLSTERPLASTRSPRTSEKAGSRPRTPRARSSRRCSLLVAQCEGAWPGSGAFPRACSAASRKFAGTWSSLSRPTSST